MRLALASGVVVALAACGDGRAGGTPGTDAATPADAALDAGDAASDTASPGDAASDATWPGDAAVDGKSPDAASPDGSAPGAIQLIVDATGAPGTYPTLAAAYAAIGAESDYDVVVRPGTYVGEHIAWSSSKLWNDHVVRIVASPGARPVFDGQAVGTFITVSDKTNQLTRLVLDGIDVRNYFQVMSIKGGDTPNSAGTFNGGFEIRNCAFDEIGDRNNDGVGQAYGAFVLEYSRNNLFENNVFHNVYSGPNDAPGQIHVVYFSHGSSNNVFRDNYVVGTSHDPIRVRNGANDNIIEGNFFERAGGWAPVTRYRNLAQGETNVKNVSLKDDLLLYGWGATMNGSSVACFDNTGGGSSEVTCAGGEFNVDATTLQFFRDARPAAVSVLAATIEPRAAVVSMTSSGVARVVRSKLEARYLGDVLWKSTTETTLALASGSFATHAGLVGVIRGAANKTRIVAGSGSGTSGLDDQGTIWDGGDGKQVATAIAAGDRDGDGKDELYVAIVEGGVGSVYGGSAAIGSGPGSSLGDLPGSIDAVAAGDLDGDGKGELVVAVDDGSSASVYSSSPGEALTAHLLGTFAAATVTALAIGEHDGDAGDGAELLTAVSSAAGGEVWLGSGTGANGARIWAVCTRARRSRFPRSPVEIWSRAARPGRSRYFPASQGVTVQIWAGDAQPSLLSKFKLWQWPRFW